MNVLILAADPVGPFDFSPDFRERKATLFINCLRRVDYLNYWIAHPDRIEEFERWLGPVERVVEVNLDPL